MDEADIKSIIDKQGKSMSDTMSKLIAGIKKGGLSESEIKRVNQALKDEVKQLKLKEAAEKKAISAIDDYTDEQIKLVKASQSLNEKLFQLAKGTGLNVVQSQRFADRAQVTGEVLGKLGKAAATGSGKIDDFTAAFKGRFGGIGDIVSLAGTSLQTNVDTFRTLSNVGAAFGQDLVKLRETAAMAGLPIEDFTKLIRDNSQSLAQLYGSSTQGAIAFSNLSRDFRTANIDFLAPLGLTVSELNDTLLVSLNLQRLTGNFDRNNIQAQTQAARGLILEIDKLAKLTGQQRTELTKQMEQQMANARFQAFLTTQTQETGDRLRTFAAGLSNIANDPAFETALLDLIANAGQPVTEIGRQLVNNVREAPQIISQLNAGLISNQQALELFRDASLRATQANARVAATGQVAFLDQFFPAVNRVGRATLNLADVNDEAAKRASSLTNSLTQFESASKELGASIQSIETGVLKNLGSLLGGGVSVISGAMKGISATLNVLPPAIKGILGIGLTLANTLGNKALQTGIVFTGTYSALRLAGLGKGNIVSDLMGRFSGAGGKGKGKTTTPPFGRGAGVGVSSLVAVGANVISSQTDDPGLKSLMNVVGSAGAGAGIGSMIAPGLGTAIGAVAGTILGAIGEMNTREKGTFGEIGLPFEPRTSLMKVHAGEVVQSAQQVGDSAKQQQELMLGVSRMTTTMGDYVNIARQQLESSKQQEKLLNTMISVDMENTKYTKLTANRVGSNKGNLIG
jgi:hypothetical protein